MPDQTIVELDRLSVVLGGLKGFITVAGKNICLRDEGCEHLPLPNGMAEIVKPNGVTASAVTQPPEQDNKCSTDELFCSNNKSFKNSFLSFYKSLGGNTSITAGPPWRKALCTVIEPFNGTCICPEFRSYAYCGSAPIGSTVTEFVRDVSGYSVLLNTRYFARGIAGSAGTVGTTREQFAVGAVSAENKVSAFGVIVKLQGGRPSGVSGICEGLQGGAFECELTGVCSAHQSRDPEGREILAVTSKGTVNPMQCFSPR
jgi:hypothetical protein